MPISTHLLPILLQYSLFTIDRHAAQLLDTFKGLKPAVSLGIRLPVFSDAGKENNKIHQPILYPLTGFYGTLPSIKRYCRFEKMVLCHARKST